MSDFATHTEQEPVNLSDVSIHDLGKQAVYQEEQVAETQLYLDNLSTQYQAAMGLEAKVHPKDGLIKYQLGRLARKSITSQERRQLSRESSAELEGRIDQQQGKLASQETKRNTSLQDIRTKLLSLNANEKWLKNLTMRDAWPSYVITPYFHNIERIKEEAKNQNREITDDEINWPDWLGKDATDEQLTNFLQWHVHIITEQSKSPEFNVAVELEREAYKVALRKGIDDGWLSKDAEAAIGKVDGVEVEVGDIFSTAMKGERGSYWGETNHVLITQGMGKNKTEQINNLKTNTNSILMHEWNHATIGNIGNFWLNEALTEHVAQSLKHGQRAVVSPEKREKMGIERRGSYTACRELLATILQAGTMQIDVDRITRIYSAAPENRVKEDGDTRRELNEAWHQSSSVINYVTERLYDLWSNNLERGMVNFVALDVAAKETRADLLERPQVVFDGYLDRSEKPKR